MEIDIYDIKGIAITNDDGLPLFSMKYDQDEITELLKASSKQKSEIYTHGKLLVLLRKLDEVNVIIYTDQERNPIYVYNALLSLCNALVRIVKGPTVKNILNKYDQISLLMNSFVYNGIIVETDVENLVNSIPRRTFEGLESMKIPEGFGSFFVNNKK